MHYTSRETVKQSNWLLIQQSFVLMGNVIFIIIVPRIFGSVNFGKYTLLFSMTSWILVLGSLGLRSVITRYVPQWVLNGEKDTLRTFFARVFALFILVGILLALIYQGTQFLLTDLNPWLFILLGGSILVRLISNCFFLMFLGFNQASRWGISEVLRRGLSLLLIIAGYGYWGLEGACAGILLSELVILIVGSIMYTKIIGMPGISLDLRQLKPFLRFGLHFYGGAVLTTAFWFSGEALIRLFNGDYSQVAYYGIARNIYLSIALIIVHLSMASVPFLVHLKIQENVDKIDKWFELMLKNITFMAVVLLYCLLYFGEPIVARVVGIEFVDMVKSIIPLAIALIAAIPGILTTALAISSDRPESHFKAAALQLAVFLIVSPLIIISRGSPGAALSFLTATIVYSGAMRFMLRNLNQFPWKSWLLQITVSAVFILPILLNTSPSTTMVIGLCSIAGCVFVQLRLNLINFSELKYLTLFIRSNPESDFKVG